MSTRLALLALGVSALPFAAQAQEAGEATNDSDWVYGVAAREAADASTQATSDVTIMARRRPPEAPRPIYIPPVSTGDSVIVGIVDTGIDLDHPEFTGRVSNQGTCFGSGSDCAGAAANGADDNGHGTHVAGIVAAAANGVGNTGVAPEATLLPVKVLAANGSGAYSSIVSGISYAASHGAKVINMSLGGSSSYAPLLSTLQSASATSVIVAAAGNNGNRSAVSYPAAYATSAGVVGSMIIVGSVDSNNKISSFSTTPLSGGCVKTAGVTTCWKDVFLVAPGRSIYSTYPDNSYAILSGTSMATPYVSGVAALVLDAAPYLTPKQVVSILFQSATDLGAKGTDTVYGRGLVNASAALLPLGTLSVATSGASTSSFAGSQGVNNSWVGGALSHGLNNSSIAKNIVFFDSYGRDFRTDLSSSASTASASLAGIVTSTGPHMKSVAAFGENFSIQGFVSDEAANSVETLGFADASWSTMSDVVMTAKLTEDTSVSFGHNASVAGRLNQLDLAASEAYDGLFMSASALNSPYMALTENADFIAASVKIGDDLTLTVGQASQGDDTLRAYEDGYLTYDEALSLSQTDIHPRSAENTAVALSWQFAPWGMVGMNAAYTEEQNSLLGTVETGALTLTDNAQTTSFGVAARVNLGDDWVASASWSHGQTEATPVQNGLITSFSNIESEAYGVALSRLGVFGKEDAIGFSVSRPLHIVGGSAVMTASTGVTEEREILYSTEVINLASSTPETDYEVGYTTPIGENMSLQASALYQQDLGGDAGRDAVAGFVTFKANW